MSTNFLSRIFVSKFFAPRRIKKLFLWSGLGLASVAWLAFAQSGKKLVVHEWGTFTSLQGGNGETIPWRIHNVVPLPSFVYDWSKPGFNRYCTSPYSSGGKGAIMAMQRMETPVIYFYSDKEQTVDLKVRFPKGLITEWYPQAHEIGPVAFPASKVALALDNAVAKTGAKPDFTFTSMIGEQPMKQSLIHWENLRINPTGKSSETKTPLPQDKNGGHYFSARETDSALLKLDWRSGTNSATEYEKFLFYRGVGNFATPLKVKMSASGDVTLINTSKEMLHELFVLGVNGDAGKFVHVENLAPGKEKTLAFDLKKQTEPLKSLSPRLANEMSRALTKQKLFSREATAMVNTWKDLWFEEPGIRALYVLPRAWTDTTLPLEIKPAPTETVRVMVGRAEVISPALEQKLVEQLSRANINEAGTREAVQATLKEFGRFAEPILVRAFDKAKCKPEDRGKWVSLLSASLTAPSGSDSLATK